MADKTVDWFAESNRYAVALMEQGLKAEQDKDKPRVQKIVANGAILADLVEVVRCKDCKHLKYGYQCYNPLGISLNNDGDAYVLVDADDFCSCGERRDNGDNI